jgi:hypothetical protein
MLLRTLAFGLLLIPAAAIADVVHVYPAAEGEPGIPVIVVSEPERGVPVRMVSRDAGGGIPVHVKYRDVSGGPPGSGIASSVPVLVVNPEAKTR